MTPKNFDTIRISSSEELKKHLFGVDSTVVIPEFKNVLEFTRDELNELKRQLESKSDNEVFIIIEAAIAKKARATLDTKKVAAAGLTSMQTEQLKQNVGEKSPEKTRQGMVDSQNKEISTIDVTKSFEKQEDKIRTLDTGLYILLQHLAVSGIKKEELSNISNFEKILTENSSKLDSSMRVVSAKILEIFKNGSPELKNYYTSKWVGLVSNIYPNARNIGEISRSMREGKTIPQGNSIMEFAKEHPIMSSVIAVAGTYGIFKVLGGLFGGDSKTEGSKTGEKGFLGGMFDKITGPWKVAIAGILGIFGLGKALEMDGVKKFFKETIGFNIDENRITKAIQLLSDGKIIEAIKVLFTGIETKLNPDGIKILKDNIKTEGKLNFEIEESILTGVFKMNARDFIISGSSLPSKVFAFAKEKVKGFLGFSGDDLKQENAIRDYLKKQVDEKKIEISKDETVEDLVIRLFPNYAKNAQKTNPDGSVSQVPVGAAAVSGGAVVAKEVSKDGEKKPDGKTEWSMDNPFLYVWMKGNRFEIGHAHARWSIRKYISSLEAKAMGIGNSSLEIKELERLETLLQKTKLDSKEQKILEEGIEKFLKKNSSFLGEFHNVVKTDIDSIIKDPELKKSLLEEQARVRQKAIEYHKDAELLRKAKYDKILNGEKELRKLSSDNKMSIKDFFKSNLGTNEFSAYSTKRKEILAEVAKIDSDILHLNNGMNANLEESLKRSNALFEKHSLPTELRARATNGVYGALDGLGVKINNLTSKIPGSGLVKGGIKLGFIGLIGGSLIRDGLAGKDTFKYDAAELGFGLLPITSEILDFKAAITGHDLAGRDLKATDRWIRAGFGVVGTVADAATLLTLGQSQWARAWLAGAKGAKAVGTGAKIGDVVNDASKLGKIKDSIFAFAESSKFTNTVKFANTGGKILTFGALGIAVYDIAGDITSGDYKKDIESAKSKMGESIEGFMKKAV